MNDNQRYLHTQFLKTTLNTLNPVIVWDKERFLYHGYNFSKNMLKQICQTNGGPKLPESIKFFFVLYLNFFQDKLSYRARKLKYFKMRQNSMYYLQFMCYNKK